MACSAESAIESRRAALTKRLEAIEAARGAAEAYREPPAKHSLSPAVVLGDWTNDGSNTLVISDAQIGWLAKKPECANSPAMEVDPRTTDTKLNCHDEGVGAGSKCVADAAALLRFGAFRAESMYAKESAEKCAAWVEGLRYVLVVHIDEQTPNVTLSKTAFVGSAILVDLETGQAKASLKLERRSEEKLGQVLEIDYAKGTETVAIERQALRGYLLGRRAISDEVSPWLPGADVRGYFVGDQPAGSRP